MTTKLAQLFLFLFISIFFIQKASSQNITNEGTEFWMAFPECHDLTAATYQVNISSKVNTSGTVEIPGTSFSQNFTVIANQITKVILPSVDAVITTVETPINRGVHIFADDLVVVYANTYHQHRSEASLVLPNTALGEKYIISSYETENTNGFKQSEFIVVAAGDSAYFEITTTTNTEGGHLANVPWTVALDTGEVYMVQAQNNGDDLTGSVVKSLDVDKRFSVYNGHVWAWTSCIGNRDPLFEVAYPVSSFGKEYIALPNVSRDTNVVRAIASEDNTDIFIDNIYQTTLNAGQFYEYTFATPTYITANKPIIASQIMASGQCDNAPIGDPALVLLNPNEQMYLDTVTFFAVDEFNIDSNYVDIVTRTPDTATVEFNSSVIIGWEVFLHDSNYAHVSFRVDTGSHNITTTSCGFLSYIYGMGFAESYYYAAGVRLNDLNDSLSFVNISTGGNQHCVVDSIQFFANLSGGNALSYTWVFGDGDSSSVQNPIHIYPDSGFYEVKLFVEYLCFTDSIIDTIQILPQPSVYLGLDTFICDPHGSITLYAGNPGFDYLWSPGGQTTDSIVVTQDGNYSVVVDIGGGVCSDADDIIITFAKEPVNNAFTSTQIACEGEPIDFSSVSDTFPNAWNWNFGDGNGNESQDQTHAYAEEGSYGYQLIIEYDCHIDTLTGTIAVFKQPSVDLGLDSAFCTPIVFEINAGNGNGGFNYDWSTGEGTQSIEVDESGTYSVVISNTYCSAEDEIVLDIPIPGIIPNVFSPNGDGYNDYFEVGVFDRCAVGDLQIQNRWGRVVFETNDPLGHFWDGRVPNGTEAKAGVYYWILTDTQNTRTGYVTLMK